MTTRTQNTLTAKHEFRLGFINIVPLAFGAAIYGVAFGLLAAQAQMSELQTGIMGTLVFAGSSQIIAIERLVAGAGALGAIIAGIALNLRILLMTASLRAELANRPLWQILLAVHLTTDENWALMHATRTKGSNVGYWYLVGGGTCLILVWVFATVVGVSFAKILPEPQAIGMDFAFTAAFIAILCNLWRGQQDIIPWITSIFIAAVLTLFAPIEPSWSLAIGGISGALIAGALSAKPSSTNKNSNLVGDVHHD